MDPEKSCARLHVICIIFTCDQFHVQTHNPPSPVFLPQRPLSQCPPSFPPAPSPLPLAPVITLLTLFLLPARVHGRGRGVRLPYWQGPTCPTPRIDSWGLTPSSGGASLPAPSHPEPGRRSRQQARLSANPSPIQPGD